MNLFTQNSPYHHLLKYLLFLLKHPVHYNAMYGRDLALHEDGGSVRCYMQKNWFL